jgi:hypothetical protein
MTHNKWFQRTRPPCGGRAAEPRRWAPMRTLALAASALALAACSAGGSVSRGTPVEPGESFPGSYISIKAPSSSGWLLTRSGGSGMTFGKEGPSPTESFIAGVSMFRLPPTSTPAEFEELIRAGARRDTPPERYEIQRELLKYTDERGYPCVRYQALAKDKQPRGSDTPLLLALDGLYCRHPKRQDTGFAVIYSFRGKTEHPDLRSEAESFLQGTQVPET